MSCSLPCILSCLLSRLFVPRQLSHSVPFPCPGHRCYLAWPNATHRVPTIRTSPAACMRAWCMQIRCACWKLVSYIKYAGSHEKGRLIPDTGNRPHHQSIQLHGTPGCLRSVFGRMPFFTSGFVQHLARLFFVFAHIGPDRLRRSDCCHPLCRFASLIPSGALFVPLLVLPHLSYDRALGPDPGAVFVEDDGDGHHGQFEKAQQRPGPLRRHFGVHGRASEWQRAAVIGVVSIVSGRHALRNRRRAGSQAEYPAWTVGKIAYPKNDLVTAFPAKADAA